MQYPLVPRPGGVASALNISAASVIKATPGTIYRVNVITAGTAPGAVYDATSTTGNTIADEIAPIPNTAGIYYLEWPCLNGIVVAPGTGQVVAVSYA